MRTGVNNNGPAESISFRTGQNHSEKGSSSPWLRTPIPHRLTRWVDPTCVRRQLLLMGRRQQAHLRPRRGAGLHLALTGIQAHS
jgi:hypothetical protein